ncbi:NO-inducible flavohemoprotein [Kurthia massiliensis]|uniref:NO-inducible flavohemoprotein n=1 Tax=Kurthia massiliensis TaxID=1033739 RepID=UPI00028834C5|nr:NO-inducible flavohemoprotein [Kurthia massiliensis]
MLSQQTMDIIKSTVPVLEVHGLAITKTFYKNLFEAHPELLNIFNHTNQSKGRQQGALANTVYAAAVHIENLDAILPVVHQIGQKHRSLGILPEHYPIVGQFLLAAIKEVLGDAATEEILGAWGEAYGVIADAFIQTEEGLYKEAEEKEGGYRGFKPFKVTKVVTENELVKSFYLVPADGAALPSYQAGQYVSVQVSIPGHPYTHNRQYSLSQAYNGQEYRISIKAEKQATPQGVVSNYLHANLKEGDEIMVSVPAGDFVYNTANGTPVTFLAAGIGATPLLAMYQTAVKENDAKVKFIHSASHIPLHPFERELLGIAFPSKNATYVPVTTAATGHIDQDFLAKHVDTTGEVYLCGPVGFMEAMITNLVAIGMPKENIHFEFFGPAMAL